MARTVKASHPYSVHPSIRYVQGIVAKMPEKTGKSLEEWTAFVVKSGPAGEKERAAWLKAKHALGTNHANWIAQRSVGKGAEDTDPELYLAAAVGYVEKMYEGPKAALRPLYEALLKLGLGLGPEAKACPCQTMVPIYRNHVIAEIKPSTKTRIDLGFALGDTKPTKRLVDTGGFAKGDRISHKIAIATLDDLDDEVTKWLRKAYDRDAAA